MQASEPMRGTLSDARVCGPSTDTCADTNTNLNFLHVVVQRLGLDNTFILTVHITGQVSELKRMHCPLALPLPLYSSKALSSYLCTTVGFSKAIQFVQMRLSVTARHVVCLYACIWLRMV